MTTLVKERTSKLEHELENRKRTEEALKKSEEKYRSLVDKINDGIFVADDKGVITFANRALAEIHGFERPEELVGRTLPGFLTPEENKELDGKQSEALRTKKHPDFHEIYIAKKDGSLAYIQSKTSLITNKNGRPIGFTGAVRDITKLKIAEQKHSGRPELRLCCR